VTDFFRVSDEEKSELTERSMVLHGILAQALLLKELPRAFSDFFQKNASTGERTRKKAKDSTI